MREYDYSKLRGRIKEKIGTQGEYAKKIGRSENFVSKVFKNKTVFSQDDIERSVELLEIEPIDIGLYFFTKVVHK